MAATVRQLMEHLSFMDPDTEVMFALNPDLLCSEPRMIRGIIEIERVLKEFSPMLNEHVAVHHDNFDAALARGASGVILIS